MKKNLSNIKSSEQFKEMYTGDYVKRFSNSQSPYRLSRLLKLIHLNQNFDVVDFACGNGLLLPYIAPKVASYVGVDFSDEFVEEANERKFLLGIENADFICDDINHFCESHLDSFDCAFAMDFSEHVYDATWSEILHSIRKSLRDRGSLYIHTPNSLFFIEQMKARSFILNQFEEHVAVRSPDKNLSLLISAGFKVKRILLLPHYNILSFLHLFSYIPFAGKNFKARIFIEAVK